MSEVDVAIEDIFIQEAVNDPDILHICTLTTDNAGPEAITAAANKLAERAEYYGLDPDQMRVVLNRIEEGGVHL